MASTRGRYMKDYLAAVRRLPPSKQDAVLAGLDTLVERIEAVTAEDVRALASEYWSPGAMSAAAIGPKGDVIRDAVTRLSPELAAA